MSAHWTVRVAVAAIIRDLRDRNGIGGEWDQIDPVIQHEIREAWEAIVLRALESPPATPPGKDGSRDE